MLTTFRHDTYNFTGESHENAREEFAGVPVNRRYLKAQTAVDSLSLVLDQGCVPRMRHLLNRIPVALYSLGHRQE